MEALRLGPQFQKSIFDQLKPTAKLPTPKALDVFIWRVWLSYGTTKMRHDIKGGADAREIQAYVSREYPSGILVSIERGRKIN